MAQAKTSNEAFAGTIARYGQFILVGVIVSVLGLMIIPMPTPLLDFFLALNIIGSVTILMVSVTITDAMKLSSFPTLLLISTLFRLGLNVSSTRLILSQGEAGEIIKTFGSFVTGGNLLVGVVVFLVLSIIQFLVVSKGSERVAEVAARFTLDALPGKQMSIDADLRAGQITQQDASFKRETLIKESKLYGSMDGAMKFVKGDTIAGFIIIFVNIIGGFASGVLDRGYDISKAAHIYTVLTIGDGLVAQIPALMTALAAGFIVTRVGSVGEAKSLGEEIGAQIFVQPKALLAVAGVALLMAFVPGFPTGLFVMLALLIAGVASAILWREKSSLAAEKSISRHLVNEDNAMVGYAEPFVLELSSDMYEKFLQDERWQLCLNDTFPQLKNARGQIIGVTLPDLKITVNKFLPPERYAIKIYEVPVDRGFLSPEHCVVRDYLTLAPTLELEDGEKTAETVHGSSIMLLQLKRQQELERQGVRMVSPEQMLIEHLGKVLNKHAHEFVGIQEVRAILTNTEKHHPELVREVVPRMLSINKLTEVIKRLVEEGIPVKDFRLILETLSGCQPDSKDVADLTEILRMGLKRVISYLYAGTERRLTCFGLDPDIEDEIRKGVTKSGGETYLNVDPKTAGKLIESVKRTYTNHRFTGRDAVILTDPTVRRYIKKIIEADLPDVPVTSFSEFDRTVKIDQRDTISLADSKVLAI